MWNEHRLGESVLLELELELDLERDLMSRVAQLKLQYFDHMAQGSVDELALMVMAGAMKGISP